MSTNETEDYSQPVLSGSAGSDYERYLKTEELLALQKTADEWVHRDELLFQVTHQSSELWLKLAWNDAEEAVRLIEEGDLRGALRLLRRSILCIRFLIPQLEMLEHMSPWEYQEIRKVLGHGSGFDSPGWNELRRVLPRLGQAFHNARREAGLTLADLYVQGRDHEHLYQLAETLIELDEQAQLWRMRHYQIVAQGDRRQRGRYPGHAGRAARATRDENVISRALGSPERADRVVECRSSGRGPELAPPPTQSRRGFARRQRSSCRA